jgi:hypothetical protein
MAALRQKPPFTKYDRMAIFFSLDIAARRLFFEIGLNTSLRSGIVTPLQGSPNGSERSRI